MKGLMVALLFLSCTGMVLAQQNDSYNGFRAGNGTGSSIAGRDNPDAPVVPLVAPKTSAGAPMSTAGSGLQSGGAFNLTQGRGSSTSPSTTINPRPVARKNFAERESGVTNRRPASALPENDKVIYLGLPASELGGLYKDGAVEAPIDNPWVDRITISDQDRPSSNPVQRIQPELRGDQLVFEFGQDKLSLLGQWSFEFEVPEHMKGKYRSAVIEYPPALARNAQSTTTQEGTGFDSTDPRWRLAGNENQRQPVTDLWKQQQDQLARERQQELDRQRWAQEQFEKEKAARESFELADKNRKLQEQIDRMEAAQQRDAALARQRWPLPDNRFADRQFDPTYSRTRPVAPPASTDTVAYSMMQQMQDRFAQLESENRRLGNEVRTVKDENDSLRRRFDIDSKYHRDLANHRRDGLVDQKVDEAPTLPNRRPLMNVGGFNLDDRTKGQEASTTKELITPQRRQGSWDLLMLLMLLASVALNLYLWAISRGFYMRYQELADELRETFAVSA